MFLGRRRFRDPQSAARFTGGPRVHTPLERIAFSSRYSVFLGLSLSGAFIFFAGPAAYFLRQNYKIFESLAYSVQPSLVDHLQRESQWLIGFLGIGFVLCLSIGLWLGMRLTQNLLAPLQRLNRHLQKIIEGEFTGNHMRYRTEEDFQQLYGTYNMMVSHFIAETEKEVEQLSKLSIDPNDRESFMILHNLIQAKKQKITDAKDSPTFTAEILPLKTANVSQRHAS